MLRTTNKKVKATIENYINESVANWADWLEETLEEASRYTELEAESRITQLLWREITKHASIAL